jgi:protein-disulfide isomerase
MKVYEKLLLIVFFVISFLIAGFPGVSAARIDVRTQTSFSLNGEGKAVAMSANGKEFFVLLDGGRVEIYNEMGLLLGTMTVGASATDIAVSPDGRKLYVVEGVGRQMRILTLERQEKFDAVQESFVAGPMNAPVTIVVFSDFQCPFCAKLNPILKQVLNKYPSQVKLEYKFFPLTSIHKLSMQAATAAQAAARQGKFWEYHDALLASYNDLSEEKFVEIAGQLGLDMERFARERRDPRFVNVIRRDIREAREHQINSVPTVFVNGRKVARRTLESFERMINTELGRQKNIRK